VHGKDLGISGKIRGEGIKKVKCWEGKGGQGSRVEGILLKCGGGLYDRLYNYCR